MHLSLTWAQAQLLCTACRICACNMILEYTLSTAAVCRGFTGYAATLLGFAPDAFVIQVRQLSNVLAGCSLACTQ